MSVAALPTSRSTLSGSRRDADKEYVSNLCDDLVRFPETLKSLHPVPYEYAVR